MKQKANKVAAWFTGTGRQLMGIFGIFTNKTTEKVETTSSTTTIDYSDKTVVQLKSIAKERGFKGYSSLKKAELINLLNN